jgi:2-oxoglutarate/2-oxoacid ferredoxin oxidoreductase subunit alpha
MGIFSKKNNVVGPKSLCENILIGGEAGEGIKSAGKLSAVALIKSGRNVFVYDEYPSLIRGGHNSISITYSTFPVYSHNREIDILLCLNKDTFEEHKNNLSSKSIVLYDRDEFEITNEEINLNPCELIEIPAQELIKAHVLPRIVKNVIFVAAGLLIIGVDKDIVLETIKEELGKNKLLDENIKTINLVYETLYEYFNLKNVNNLSSTKSLPTIKEEKIPRYLMNGNDAIALGGIKGGLQFYAAYPMTPASSILDTMFHFHKDYDFVVKQAEDEIAAINMAIGAAFAGVRSMVGTAGGGFSLMVEGLGLAAITETPLVIVVSQRPGPATGLPTWTGQADILFILHASQDEFPRIILTPTDVEECFYLTFKALNLAEKYQLPVFVVVDKYLSESLQFTSLKEIKNLSIDRGLMLNDRILLRLDSFNRYEETPTGISPRSIPGQQNGIFLANSDESDSKGYTSESSSNRKVKVEKRFNKLKQSIKDLPQVDIYGDPKAQIGIIVWGSTKGPALEAMRRLQSIGKECKLIALNRIEPFPSEEVSNFIKQSKTIVLVEGNFTSQLGQLILLNTDYEIEHKLLKYDGRPIHPDEIVNYISNIK